MRGSSLSFSAAPVCLWFKRLDVAVEILFGAELSTNRKLLFVPLEVEVDQLISGVGRTEVTV